MDQEQDQEQQLLGWLPRLRRYARALVGDRDEADDLVQDTLERAWARASLWRGVGDMRAWLFGIMHNLHADARRRPRLKLQPLDPQFSEPALPPSQGERLAVLDLQGALDLLPDEQRQVLLLVALEDMAYAEVALLLDIPIGTVMSRLSRGRERLRALLVQRETPHAPAGSAPHAPGLKRVK
ncbi:MAG: RNA polymerase sigma factor [Burkholderiaceae bacterium]